MRIITSNRNYDRTKNHLPANCSRGIISHKRKRIELCNSPMAKQWRDEDEDGGVSTEHASACSDAWRGCAQVWKMFRRAAEDVIGNASGCPNWLRNKIILLSSFSLAGWASSAVLQHQDNFFQINQKREIWKTNISSLSFLFKEYPANV